MIKKIITLILTGIFICSSLVTVMADNNTSSADTGAAGTYRNGSSMTTLAGNGDGSGFSYRTTERRIITGGNENNVKTGVSSSGGSSGYTIADKMQEYAFIDAAAYEAYINSGSGISYNGSTGTPVLDGVQIGDTNISAGDSSSYSSSGSSRSGNQSSGTGLAAKPGKSGNTDPQYRLTGFFGTYTGWLDDSLNEVDGYLDGVYYAKNGSLVLGNDDSPAKEKLGVNYFFFDSYGRKLSETVTQWKGFFKSSYYALDKYGRMITSRFVRVWDEGSFASDSYMQKLDTDSWQWVYAGSSGELYKGAIFKQGLFKYYACNSAYLASYDCNVNGKYYYFYAEPAASNVTHYESDTAFRTETSLNTNWAVHGWIHKDGWHGDDDWYYADNEGRFCTGKKKIEVNGTNYTFEFNKYGRLISGAEIVNGFYESGQLYCVEYYH